MTSFVLGDKFVFWRQQHYKESILNERNKISCVEFGIVKTAIQTTNRVVWEQSEQSENNLLEAVCPWSLASLFGLLWEQCVQRTLAIRAVRLRDNQLRRQELMWFSPDSSHVGSVNRSRPQHHNYRRPALTYVITVSVQYVYACWASQRPVSSIHTVLVARVQVNFQFQGRFKMWVRNNRVQHHPIQPLQVHTQLNKVSRRKISWSRCVVAAVTFWNESRRRLVYRRLRNFLKLCGKLLLIRTPFQTGWIWCRSHSPASVFQAIVVESGIYQV